MKKKRKEVPSFASEEEEARFWATHDTTDYYSEEVPDGEIEVDPEFRAEVLRRARRKQLLSLRLEKRQIAQAKRISRKKGIAYQTLMRSWIEEGIRSELAKEFSVQAFREVTSDAVEWAPVEEGPTLRNPYGKTEPLEIALHD